MQLTPLFTAKKTITLSIAAALVGSWTVNAAEQETQAQENIEQISVIGSRRLGRTVEDSPVPIDIISNDALKSSGQTETNALLSTLLPSFNFPQPYSIE